MKKPALVLLVPLMIFGCDSSAPTGGTEDATTATDSAAPADTTVGRPDTTVPSSDTTATSAPDTAEDTTAADTGPGDTTSAGCDQSGFTAVAQSYSSSDGTTIAAARSAEGAPYDVLQLELYTYGDYRGATEPGTYDLTGSNYQDCSNCVVVKTECNDSGCAKRFLVDQGNLVITQWDLAGGRFKAHLEGATAHEVLIDSETYASTLVPGGETWCLDGVEIDAEVPTLPVSDRTQPTCVADGTGTIVGDNIANFALMDCNGRRVKLHADCNDPTKKALWLIGTTGWCTACHEFLSGFVADHGGYLSREILGEKDKGLDMLIVLGEDSNGQKPTAAYCKAYAEDLGIDPAMVVIDWSDEPVDLPVIGTDIVVQTNGLGTLWHYIDPYLQNEGGSVVTTYPWWALLRPRNMEYVWSDRAALQGFEVTLLGLLAE